MTDERDGSSFTPPPERRVMTDREREIARALGKCRFLPASTPKRFAHEMAAKAELDGAQLSEKQGHYLLVLAWQFRRQMPPRLVPSAQPLPFGVRRKPNELAGSVTLPPNERQSP